MTHALRIAALCALLGGCQNEIWLSDPDVGQLQLDGGLDAHVERDAYVPDADVPDAGEIDADEDAAMQPLRGCEGTPVSVTNVRAVGPLEMPTFAASGMLDSLRFAVLIPPAASTATTGDTRIVLLDREGAPVEDRSLLIEDASGTPSSHATIHSLSPLTSDEGFLVLAPTGIWLLDASGVGSEVATLTTPPSTTWQRAAGWIDSDRFVFVSDTVDLRLAVFDRTTSVVTTTSISAANAATIHVDPGGVTMSVAPPASEAVVYDPDLSGSETLRVAWSEGVLGERLRGAAVVGGVRTWLVNTPDEFRFNVVSYRIEPGMDPALVTSMAVLGPVTATREGPFVAIATENPLLVLFDFEAQTFSTIASAYLGSVLVEHERDGEHAAVLFLDPVGASETSLSLACGRH